MMCGLRRRMGVPRSSLRISRAASGSGGELWIGIGRAQLGERRQVVAAVVAIGVGSLAMSRKRFAREWRRFRKEWHILPRGKICHDAGDQGLSSGYLYATARYQQRDFSPILHDEYAYLIQTKMWRVGICGWRKHEVADFFETFHVVTDRVYAAKYGPGTAMFYAPGVWLKLAGVDDAFVAVGGGGGADVSAGSGTFRRDFGMAGGDFAGFSGDISADVDHDHVAGADAGAGACWRCWRLSTGGARSGVGWMMVMGVAVGWGRSLDRWMRSVSRFLLRWASVLDLRRCPMRGRE